MNKKTYISLLTIGLIILIYASFNDMALSNQLYGKMQGFGKLFEVIGGSPAYLLIAGCGAGLAYINKRKIMQVCLSGGSILSFSLFFKDMVAYAISPGGTDSKASVGMEIKIISLLIAIVCFMILLTGLKKIGKQVILKYRKQLLGVLLACLFQLFIQESTKIIFARPRYWSIIDGTNQFQNWYQARGPLIDNARMSFYSGHTANAYMSIFASCLTNNPKTKHIIISAGLVFGTCTAISRIVMGQHFLSDVTMSFIIVISLFYFVNQYLNKSRSH